MKYFDVSLDNAWKVLILQELLKTRLNNLYVEGFDDYVLTEIIKELSLWNNIKYLNLNIFRTRCCKPLIFQTQIIWSNRINSLKYLRSATFGSKDKVIRKSEFVAKTQFLCSIAPVCALFYIFPFVKLYFQNVWANFN